MVFKIGCLADMQNVEFENADIKQTVYHYANILSAEYGADRNVDTDDGGYILYATRGTTVKEIKTFFDYTEILAEFVDIEGDICSALYLLSNDYGVVIIMSLADTPTEILKEIKDEKENKQ